MRIASTKPAKPKSAKMTAHIVAAIPTRHANLTVETGLGRCKNQLPRSLIHLFGLPCAATNFGECQFHKLGFAHRTGHTCAPVVSAFIDPPRPAITTERMCAWQQVTALGVTHAASHFLRVELPKTTCTKKIHGPPKTARAEAQTGRGLGAVCSFHLSGWPEGTGCDGRRYSSPGGSLHPFTSPFPWCMHERGSAGDTHHYGNVVRGWEGFLHQQKLRAPASNQTKDIGAPVSPFLSAVLIFPFGCTVPHLFPGKGQDRRRERGRDATTIRLDTSPN